MCDKKTDIFERIDDRIKEKFNRKNGARIPLQIFSQFQLNEH